MKIEKETRYERLGYPAEEAQVDFGNMAVVKDGVYKDLKSLSLSFPYSNVAYVYPLPAENNEFVLEGLKQLVHQVGGILTHLRIDNIFAAVVTVRKGNNSTYTDAFLQFQMHYNFEVQPCSPYSGLETIGLRPLRLWRVFPNSHAHWLEVQTMKSQKCLHYKREVMIEDLWKI